MSMALRWKDYVFGSDDRNPSADSLLKEVIQAASGSALLYVLGEGFDPRTTVSMERFLSHDLAALSSVEFGVLDLDPNEEVADASVKTAAHLQAQKNRAALSELLSPYAVTRIPFPKVRDVNAAGLRFAHGLATTHLPQTGLFVLDISALPVSIYFPILGTALESRRAGETAAEILVLVCENPDLDNAIATEGIVDAGPIRGFQNPTADEEGVRVWAPVLGSAEISAIKAIRGKYDPDEICPVLPFPARDPRRSDSLLREYREELWDVMQVEPANFIHADERNPFDLYRRLVRLHDRYQMALQKVRSVELILSAHSSKLLSLGVFLAAYEKKLLVASANSLYYSLNESADISLLSKENRVTVLWLDGAPYA